jgi:tetratricopeptide (TPR) repeat protein
LGAAIGQRKISGWSADPAADLSQAIAHAKNAIRLARQDAFVIARSAHVLFTSDGDEVELANSLLEEAILLDPNGTSGWLYGGFAKMYLGNHQTAIDYFQRALRLSPLDPRIFQEGLKCAANSLRHQPSYLPSLRAAMVCNAASGNIEAAQKLWQQVAPRTPSDRVSEAGCVQR